uniref:Uncharacterized protein n=1 Tax=Rhipicephalus zambeziensis TaxID=60191 RepID=A0A224YF64_9ACAR
MIFSHCKSSFAQGTLTAPTNIGTCTLRKLSPSRHNLHQREREIGGQPKHVVNRFPLITSPIPLKKISSMRFKYFRELGHTLRCQRSLIICITFVGGIVGTRKIFVSTANARLDYVSQYCTPFFYVRKTRYF